MALGTINLFSNTVTASGSGNLINTRAVDLNALLVVNVTAASGTSPTLDVTVKGVVNGAEITLGTFNFTAAGVQTAVLNNAPRWIRVDYTVGGTTPSFTFNVDVERSVA